jgi:2-polyprenyl-3-methyl-5-hydroxy-6-metoxy-1,4-benzoquinol methylase
LSDLASQSDSGNQTPIGNDSIITIPPTREKRAALERQGAGDWPADGLERLDACPICGSVARTLLYADMIDMAYWCAPGYWTAYRCHGCKSSYLDPRPTRETIALAYRNYPTHNSAPDLPAFGSTLQELDRVIGSQGSRLMTHASNGYLWKRWRYRIRRLTPLDVFTAPILQRETREHLDYLVFWLPRSSSGLRVLEVGCGNGVHLAQLHGLGWQVEGIDPDPDAVRSAQGAGLDARVSTIYDANLLDNYYDAIVMQDVIEHVHDPNLALQICRRALRPGGVIRIGTPNLDAVGHARFARDWTGLDPPRHLFLFTRKSLNWILKRNGFKVAEFQIPGVRYNYRTSALAMDGKPIWLDDTPLSPDLLAEIASAERQERASPEHAEEIYALGRK